MRAVAVRLRFHGHPHHRGERARHPGDRPQTPVKWFKEAVWMGSIHLGSFWTGHLHTGPQGCDGSAPALPAGHPEKFVPQALTHQERILARELGWIR
ncbi:DUF6059 family protein [Streptomyces sp. HF10]|uniref:DUF6059 family protein n=1 Tax=Streptomyces sp. HF10 TaxID=2692233 RepID=UPI003FA78DD6